MTVLRSAGGIVLGPHGKVIVVNQNRDSWSLPKGHVDPGETDLEAAKREISEEAGISELTYLGPAGSYTRTRLARGGGEDPSQKKRLVFFLFSTPQVRLRPTDPHNPEARWVEPDQVHRLLTHPKDKAFFLKVRKRCRLAAAVRVGYWRSPLGWLEVRWVGKAVTQIAFCAQPKRTRQTIPAPFRRALACFFAARTSPCKITLQGTPFQKKVWAVLRRIRTGSVLSYAEVARRAGFPHAVRAAASAVGDNPVCLLVPCHRVITSAGKLGGYAYGVKLKASLLKLEGIRI